MNHLHDESTGGPAFPAMEVRTDDTQDLVESFQKSVAAQAYSQDDAMLAARARPSISLIAQAKIAKLREQGFTDYPVVATLQNGMHVCTVDNFGAVRWFSSEDAANASK